ncbi:tRNA uridine-5-carboxymethylaminomethyl(34) synthesis enzyme MnmG [Sphingomonas ginkgonis]|uniref:tRNA uridine 5-carboxymethylaminomethyl modification enzyme MnmG n=1 Tax=Sphingomonas ginkgonis TaxID=2315330 RepID=A0A429V733_9SPHN|nr:tRNA uridine-5-carboxymethylaminomethyl(34) synthesis enzyme MnmG [Sphingomonas ginkgonis]RST29753.1 tRNA uridine-5-carboxymethylaminomethyl(34) synthesis enzyme MnmG [Sphingomonas ginkgonis]
MVDMFDVIVIGAGHAGCEAATAAARRGARVALLSFDRANLGQMSCNPSIGGVGKGHLVRELDVFDGLMARAADRAAIHRRMLNRSKGPAVWGPRVQADRSVYASAIREMVGQSGVRLIEGEATDLVFASDRLRGVKLSDGTILNAHALVIATGTFLSARLFIGEQTLVGGRTGEKSAHALSARLREIGLGQGRLKTGTPPRLDGRTIDWARLESQHSDADHWSMSFLSLPNDNPQLSCAVTRTNEHTHEVIRSAKSRSPLYSGAIGGRGPRYCPSIEDKVQRFGDRHSHQIFLEPESLTNHAVYPNGVSTSLPIEIQRKFLRTIEGLERVQISKPGYAVEYEFVDPRRLDSTLSVKGLKGLFLAGQINGTTGYEEAAGQGLVAGLNAAAVGCDLAPVLFDRTSSYIGVMIDDLTLQGVSEPYRMMTARSEYRLALRADNATTRLGTTAIDAACISVERRKLIERHLTSRASPTWSDTPEGAADALYAPYLDRQKREWEQVQSDRKLPIPLGFAYRAVPGLSGEMVERLASASPDNLEQASRIPGITPAALSALNVALVRAAA